MNPELILTPGEKLSPVWQKVLRILEAKLEAARGALEASHTLDETNVLRGQIKTLRSLLRMNEDTPSVIDLD